MGLDLDIRTLFVALTLGLACLAAVLSFTALTQKTYPGFKQWTQGAVAVALGYVLLMARDHIPYAISIVAGNMCFVGGGALVYAGTRRFLGLKPLKAYPLAVTLIALAALAWFCLVRDSSPIRVLVIGLVMPALVLPVTWWLHRHAPPGDRLLHEGTAGALALLCLALMARVPISLWQGPAFELFSRDMTQTGFFLIATLAQLLAAIGFLLINQGRLANELRRSQAELAITADNLERILDFLPDPTWVVDREGKVLFWNRALAQLSGLGAEEVVGKGDYEYALPFYGQRRPMLIDLVRRRDERWEKEYLSLHEEQGALLTSKSFHPHLGKRGLYLAGTAACLYDEQGQVIGAIESVRDITGNELAQQEREALIEQLREALDNVKTLKGLIPICSHCKKIRRDEGYWGKGGGLYRRAFRGGVHPWHLP